MAENLASTLASTVARIVSDSDGLIRSREVRIVNSVARAYQQQLKSKPDELVPPQGVPMNDKQSIAILKVLNTAVKSAHPKLAETALNGVAWLVGAAVIRGEAPLMEADISGTHPVCLCVAVVAAASEATVEVVQLTAVRAMLACATSRTLVLHGETLLQAVRFVHNTLLAAEGEQVTSASRNALSMVLGTLSRSMVMASARQREQPAPPPMVQEEAPAAITAQQEQPKPTPPAQPPPAAESAAATSDEEVVSQVVADAVARVVAEVEGNDPPAATPTPPTPRSAPPSIVEPAAPTQQLRAEDVANERELSRAAESADMGALEAALEQARSLEGGAALTATLESEGDGTERDATISSHNVTATTAERAPDSPRELLVEERDLALVLRSLCKLSARELKSAQSPQSSAGVIDGVDPLALRSKRLALELVREVLDGAEAWGVRARLPLVHALRPSFSVCLLRNALSPIPAVFQQVRQLLGSLLLQPAFRAALKPEVGAFYPLVLLRSLEAATPQDQGSAGAAQNSSATPSAAQVASSLRIAKRVCAEPQLLADLFVNYDCDVEGANLFERTGVALGRLSCARGYEWRIFVAPSGAIAIGGSANSMTDVPFSTGGGMAASANKATAAVPMSNGSAGVVEELSVGVAVATLRRSSLQCCLSLLYSISAWAGSLGEPPTVEEIETGDDDEPNDDESAREVEVDDAASGVSIGSSGVGAFAHASMLSDSTLRDDDLNATRLRSTNSRVRSTSAVGVDDHEVSSSHRGTPEAATYEELKAQKTALQAIVDLFKEKPKKAVKQAIASGLCGETTEEIAHWLRDTPGLVKTAIGEYLGGHTDEEIEVMHKFQDGMNYHNIVFDEAIRLFLSSFRLPGEAQKIDRLMEKFAARYCDCNPEGPLSFPSADTAYVLAFATIMLNTDAHSSQIKNKMSKESFVKMNKGDGDTPGASEEMCSGIYDRITTNEIKTKDDDKLEAALANQAGRAKEQSTNFLNVLNIKNLFTGSDSSAETLEASRMLSMRIIERTRDQLARGGARGRAFRSARDPSLARPMLDAIGRSLAQALLSTVEDRRAGAGNAGPSSTQSAEGSATGVSNATDGSTTVSSSSISEEEQSMVLCLDGVCVLARISSALGLGYLRDETVVGLVKCTGLDPDHLVPPEALTTSNIAACECVLTLASELGTALADSVVAWRAVLGALSTMEMYRQLLLDELEDVAEYHHNGQDGAAAPAPAVASTPATTRPGAPSPAHSALSDGVLTESPAAAALASVGRFFTGRSAPAPTPQRRAPPTAKEMRARKKSQLERSKIAPWLLRPALSVEMDRVYQRSSRLDGDAIVAFAKALCAVSVAELQLSESTDGDAPAKSTREKQVPQARTYSLQRLVEVAHHNLNRIRLVWSKMWVPVGKHLVAAATASGSASHALYAVDSLRQLTAVLLSRDSLSGYHFQAEVLRPFVEIMKFRSLDAGVRELTVRCVCQLVSSRGSNLRRGWQTVLRFMCLAVADTSEHVAAPALTCVEEVVESFFKADQRDASDVNASPSRQRRASLVPEEYFGDVLACLSACAHSAELNGHDDLGKRGISAFGTLGMRLGSCPEASSNEHHWLPLLGSLAEVAMDTDAPARLDIPESSAPSTPASPEKTPRGVAPPSPVSPGREDDPASSARAAHRRRAGDMLLKLLEQNGTLLGADTWQRLSERVLVPLAETSSMAVLLPRIVGAYAICPASAAAFPNVLPRLSSTAASLACAAAEATEANMGSNTWRRVGDLVVGHAESGVATFASLAKACAACGDKSESLWNSLISAASSVAGSFAAGGASNAAAAEAELWRARVITAVHTTAGTSLPTAAAKALLERLDAARAKTVDALQMASSSSSEVGGDSALLVWRTVLNEVDTSRIGCLERWSVSEARRGPSTTLDEAGVALSVALSEAVSSAAATIREHGGGDETAYEPHAEVAAYALHVLADASRCADRPFAMVLSKTYTAIIELSSRTNVPELRSAVAQLLLSTRVVNLIMAQR
ncbi:brefeldin A-inhibited guanine nucleotide-exchange protein [Pycnococcus provasolii]